RRWASSSADHPFGPRAIVLPRSLEKLAGTEPGGVDLYVLRAATRQEPGTGLLRPGAGRPTLSGASHRLVTVVRAEGVLEAVWSLLPTDSMPTGRPSRGPSGRPIGF